VSGRAITISSGRRGYRSISCTCVPTDNPARLVTTRRSGTTEPGSVRQVGGIPGGRPEPWSRPCATPVQERPISTGAMTTPRLPVAAVAAARCRSVTAQEPAKQASPLRGPQACESRSTQGPAGATASTASSTNTPRSHYVDEVFGTTPQPRPDPPTEDPRRPDQRIRRRVNRSIPAGHSRYSPTDLSARFINGAVDCRSDEGYGPFHAVSPPAGREDPSDDRTDRASVGRLRTAAPVSAH
jgi:hypothetical protein